MLSLERTTMIALRQLLSVALLLSLALCICALYLGTLRHNLVGQAVPDILVCQAQPDRQFPLRACALCVGFPHIEAATKRHRADNETTSEVHRKYIQHAMKAHPNSMTARDNGGPLR